MDNHQNIAGKLLNLTQSQLMIWMGQQLNPNAPLYNMAMTFELKGVIDVRVFKIAFQKLIDQVSTLRTIIRIADDIPQQQILDQLSDPLEILDFTDWENPQEALINLVSSRSQKLFNPSEPLFDSALIKTDSQKYVWYFNQHHLITDGWSLALIYNTLSQFYDLALKDAMDSVNPIPVYEDFIIYEENLRKKLESNTVLKSYWQKKVSQLPAPPRLFGQVIKNPTSRSERLHVNLGKERTEKLRALTQEADLRSWSEDLSLYPIFATVLFAYIYRISKQHKLAVGSISHNRNTAVFKQTPGLFMEVYPLLCEISTTDSFSSLFEKVRTEAFDILKYAQPGITTPELSKSINVIINYINAKFAPFNGQAVQSSWIHPNHHDPHHHIRLQVHDFDNSGSIQLLFDLNCEAFDESTRAVIPTHFVNLLDHFIADRTQSISTCSFITPVEQQALLRDFNSTDVDHDHKETLVTLFEKQVNRTPDQIALFFENQQLTYHELNQKSNQLGHFLRRKGIGPDQMVAVCMDRSIEMVIALYGILKAGAAYLPINPHEPESRINFVIEDAKAAITLTQQLFQSKLAEAKSEVISLDAEWETISQESGVNPEQNTNEKNLAYTIYTSGSTGQPKGVLIPHEGIVNRLLWIQDLQPLDTTDKVLQKTPYTFDVSVWEFFWPLQQGAQLVIAKPEGHKDSRYLIRMINDHGITVIHFVPSMLALFLEDEDAQSCLSLRQVHCSGEALTIDLQRRFFQQFKAALLNLYGPTEASVDVSYWRCDRSSAEDFIPIGRPAANTQLYILDEHLNPVPKGTPGELHIGGIQVAKGYLNRDALTAERFVKDRFRPKASAKLYKTGDLARYSKDGIIQYLGRLDNQVKLRGFRIELGEIETVMNQHPGIRQAVVILREDEAIQQQLVAYFTGEKSLADESIRSFLTGRLPEYMIPSLIIWLEEFALSSSGKIDRKALPAIVGNRTTTAKNYVEPRTDIEEELQAIWEEVFQVSPISIHDNFIHLGGHSLMAIRLMARINKGFDLELPINLIFDKQTIAILGEHIEETITQLLDSYQQNETAI